VDCKGDADWVACGIIIQEKIKPGQSPQVISVRRGCGGSSSVGVGMEKCHVSRALDDLNIIYCDCKKGDYCNKDQIDGMPRKTGPGMGGMNTTASTTTEAEGGAGAEGNGGRVLMVLSLMLVGYSIYL